MLVSYDIYRGNCLWKSNYFSWKSCFMPLLELVKIFQIEPPQNVQRSRSRNMGHMWSSLCLTSSSFHQFGMVYYSLAGCPKRTLFFQVKSFCDPNGKDLEDYRRHQRMVQVRQDPFGLRSGEGGLIQSYFLYCLWDTTICQPRFELRFLSRHRYTEIPKIRCPNGKNDLQIVDVPWLVLSTCKKWYKPYFDFKELLDKPFLPTLQWQVGCFERSSFNQFWGGKSRQFMMLAGVPSLRSLGCTQSEIGRSIGGELQWLGKGTCHCRNIIFSIATSQHTPSQAPSFQVCHTYNYIYIYLILFNYIYIYIVSCFLYIYAFIDIGTTHWYIYVYIHVCASAYTYIYVCLCVSTIGPLSCPRWSIPRSAAASSTGGQCPPLPAASDAELLGRSPVGCWWLISYDANG